MANSSSFAIVLHHDELFMKQTLQFSETLKDLKNLREQLYSAAEYFETAYVKEEDKETVIETLKEYTAKAIVNTVDHLGSVSDNFNSFLSDNSSHFSTTHLRLSSLEQRMKLCREHIGTNQHSLLFQSPHHHKRYFFPHSCIQEKGRDISSFSAGDYSHRFKNAVRTTILENYPNPSRQAKKTGNFSFSPSIHNNKTPSKRTSSPMRFGLLRSGSLLKRPSSPSKTRILTLPEPQRGITVSRNKEINQSRKGKMLKALMSMSKSRN